MLFISEKGFIKLGDFGLAEELNSSSSYRTLICGTPSYMAPEVFEENSCLKSDIWSLGIIAIELAEGKHPFDSCLFLRIMKRVTIEDSPTVSSSHWSSDFVDFIRACLIKDPEERPSASTLLRVRAVIRFHHSIRLSWTPPRASRQRGVLRSSWSWREGRAKRPWRKRSLLHAISFFRP